MRVKTALLSLVLLPFVAVSSVSAQGLSNGTAVGVTVAEQNVPNGSIISSTDEGYKFTRSPYDTKIFGVSSVQPALYLKDTSAKNNVPVISTGNAIVRVSTMNGKI